MTDSRNLPGPRFDSEHLHYRNKMTQNSHHIEKQKLLVFDLAGTLIDEGSEAPVRAFEEAFKQAGHPTTRETIVRYMGTNKREHIGYILTEMDNDS